MTSTGTLPMRQRLLDAAVELFAEKGFDATSVQEIVDRARVTKGALYHHFDSKQDLLYEIYHALIGIQLADLDRIVASGLSAVDTLRAVILDVVETTAARIGEAAVFFREMHRLDPEHLTRVRTDRRRYHETFRGIIERAQRSGDFSRVASAETVTLVVFGVVNQLPQWYRPNGPKSPREIANEIADLVLAALHPAHR